MLQIFQTATSQRAALYTKCQLLLQGSVKLKKTVILEWKSHKSKAQSSGVCINIKKKVIGISHSFILWIRESRNGKFKITYIYFEFFLLLFLILFLFLYIPWLKGEQSFYPRLSLHFIPFSVALYSARKQICYKFVETAGTYNRAQKFFWSLVFCILSICLQKTYCLLKLSNVNCSARSVALSLTLL